MSPISVVQLGRLDYPTGLRLQQQLVDLRKAGQVGDVLLLLEHTPVITLGRNAQRKNILASDEQLAARGVAVFECDRGGDVTFHGPGQLVGYPIFDLRGLATTPEGMPKTLGAVDFVRRLEEVLIRACADFGVPATRVPGLTGVWTDPAASTPPTPRHRHPEQARLTAGKERAAKDPYSNQKIQSKLAAIGIHVSRGVTSHGFALNVAPDLSFFNLIIPCGITSKPVTSLEKELRGDSRPRVSGRAPARQPEVPAFDHVARSVARHFGLVFCRQILWLRTLDELLGHKVGVPMKVPEEIRRLRGDEDTFLA